MSWSMTKRSRPRQAAPPSRKPSPYGDFRDRLRLALAHDGRLKAEVASAAGFSAQTITDLLNGRRRPDRIAGRLSEVLKEAPLVWLLTGEDPPDWIRLEQAREDFADYVEPPPPPAVSLPWDIYHCACAALVAQQAQVRHLQETWTEGDMLPRDDCWTNALEALIRRQHGGDEARGLHELRQLTGRTHWKGAKP